MNQTFDTLLQNVLALAVLAVALLPAFAGAVRDRRVDLRLRDAEEGRDRRTGVLLVFDLAYGPHEDRVRRATPPRDRRP